VSGLINRLIRNKKLTRYLINNCYPVGIDGTQKIAFSALWDEHLLQRRIGPKVDPDSEEEQKHQYYVYVLEASLCFRNGLPGFSPPMMRLTMASSTANWQLPSADRTWARNIDRVSVGGNDRSRCSGNNASTRSSSCGPVSRLKIA
jgi:hypothetical protein